MIDMSTRYLGLTLKSPIVASASPLCESVDNLRRMEDAGIAAVVLPSLFEEQLQLDSQALDSDLSRGDESFAESSNYFPALQTYNLGPEGYLDMIRRSKKALSIPVIASLNGVSDGGWVRYAGLMQEAGADAIELNLYGLVTDPKVSSSQVEQGYCELVSQVKASVTIPVAVKLSPFFTAHSLYGAALGRGRRRCVGLVQSVLPAGIRSGIAGGCAVPNAEQFAGVAAAPPLGCASLRPGQVRVSPSLVECTTRETC